MTEQQQVAQIRRLRRTLRALASHLEEDAAEYRDAAMDIPRKPTDAQVKKLMAGSAWWDDPPPDWTKRDLIMFSRGYLWREESLCRGIAGHLRAEAALAREALKRRGVKA